MTTATRNHDEDYKEYFRAMGKLSKRGMALKAKEGDFPGCAPVGYLNKSDGIKRYIAIDDDKASLVQEAFRLALDPNTSIRSILKTVTEKGLTSRISKPLSVSSLWKVLTNLFYTGTIRFDGETFPGKHQPIITKEVFEKVQENLVLRSKRKTSNSSP